MKWCEVSFSDEYSIAIKAERLPTNEEAFKFMKSDCDKHGYALSDIVDIREIDDYEAHEFFDMQFENSFPVFK